ncbi:MAG: protein ral secretion pathway protein [Candidatus Parcubacteria bacterium]|jgi:prepilin-type N-terminal cleavage/methylation domain-containing protein
MNIKGFTLIELLVVIAIIGLLSTVIAGPVQSARKKGRDAKKIADLRAIRSALSQYAEDNAGVYPASLAALAPTYIQVMPSNILTATAAKDKYMYVTFMDAQSNIVSYHLGVKLESTSPALQADADCRGTTCSTATGNVTNTNYAAAGAGNPAATAAGPVANAAAPTADFNGAGANEASGNVCTAALTNCIYDMVPEN